MTDPVVYGHGATAPPLDIDIVRGRQARTPVVLDDTATVAATIVRPGHDTLTRNAVVEDRGAANRPARVRIVWQAGDLVNTGVTDIEYLIDLAITAPAGIEVLPAPLTFRVRPPVA